MEQIIFKVGPSKNITVCVSFYPKDSGIDDLFEEVMKILCSETGLKRHELQGKFDFDAVKSTIRRIAIMNLIKNSCGVSGDIYEVLEHISESNPQIKDLRESRETYERIRNLKIEMGEKAASLLKYDDALKFFKKYPNDFEVRFRMILCYLAMQKDCEARKLLNFSRGPPHEKLYGFMCLLLECYLEGDMTPYMKEVNGLVHDEKNTYLHSFLASPFMTVMISRIKSIVSDVSGGLYVP